MEKDLSLFEEIRRKLTLEEEVSPKEYLYFLAVAQIPQLKYLQETKGNCLEDRKLMECTQSLRTASPEGYEDALKLFEAFKAKDSATLEEQRDKDYENKLFAYERDVKSVKYQEKLFNATRENIKKFDKFEKFQADVNKFLDDVQASLDKQKESLKKPKKETLEEYKERVTKSYEEALSQYKAKLEEEKDMTIEGINKFVNEFMGVLDGCKN